MSAVEVHVDFDLVVDFASAVEVSATMVADSTSCPSST
jgi:hypothetical protein